MTATQRETLDGLRSLKTVRIIDYFLNGSGKMVIEYKSSEYLKTVIIGKKGNRTVLNIIRMEG